MDQNSQHLFDIESIKSLKAKYCRTMHHKDWSNHEHCFTEDLVADFREAPGLLAKSRQSYLEHMADILCEAVCILHSKMPEITLLNTTTATGIWAVDDFVRFPSVTVEGWGHSHEYYRKEQGSWKISKIRLSRLRVLINGSEQNVDYRSSDVRNRI